MVNKIKQEIEIENEYDKMACEVMNDETKLEIVLKLKKGNKELKDKISSYKVMQARWEGVAELFGDKIHWGESKSLKTFDLVKKLQEENATLKAQLADIKYLNRQEVEKIMSEFNIQNVPNVITDICKLALPDKDK